jgi:hypothetical protein
MPIKPLLTITVPIAVSFSDIVSQLCSAFEGGSNYWYRIDKQTKPENFENSEKDYIKYPHLSYPINKGGSLTISVLEGVDEDQDGKTFALNLESIQKGLVVMAQKYPHHFKDLKDGDQTTGDVLLQCCLFGDVIYG